MMEERRGTLHSLSCCSAPPKCQRVGWGFDKVYATSCFYALGFFPTLNVISDTQIKRAVFNIWCSLHLKSTLNPAVRVCFWDATVG